MQPTTRFSLPLIFLSLASIVHSQCTLQVPQNPLTAQGLATPYILTGCNQLDFANFGVFVEAAIIDPATGDIQIYNPLVINAGMTPVGNTTSSSSAKISSSSSAKTSTSAISTTSSKVMTSNSSSLKTSTGNTGEATSLGRTSSASSSKSSNTISTTSSAGTKVTPVARATATQGAGFYIPPIVPTLPADAVVGLWFGSNANTVTLTGDTATCVNGLDGSVFGQFAYCNAPAWFSAATTAVRKGLTKVSVPGTGTGQACPTIRDFRIVDQDQSDNVVTTYLMIGGNTLAQNTPANSQANPNAEVLSNGSDNALISDFIQPALGCTPYASPCTTCPKGQTPALATNELQASFFPPAGTTAMVPLNDPMVLVNGQQSLQKVNLYRSGVNQAQADNANASGTTYCQQFTQSGLFISLNQQLFSGKPSAAPNQATNLFTFLAMRFSMSFGPAPGLGCTQLLNVNNPVTLTTDGNGVVTAATINTQVLQQLLGGTTTTNTTSTSASKSSTSTSKSSANTSSTGTSKSSASTSKSSTGTSNVSTSTAKSSSSILQSSTRSSQSSASSIASGIRLVSTTSTAKTSVVTPTSSHGQSSSTNIIPSSASSSAATSCTHTVTVTVTSTPTTCLSSQSTPTSTTKHGREHSRMQKKARHAW